MKQISADLLHYLSDAEIINATDKREIKLVLTLNSKKVRGKEISRFRKYKVSDSKKNTLRRVDNTKSSPLREKFPPTYRFDKDRCDKNIKSHGSKPNQALNRDEIRGKPNGYVRRRNSNKKNHYGHNSSSLLLVEFPHQSNIFYTDAWIK